jgi:hypothetical protein
LSNYWKNGIMQQPQQQDCGTDKHKITIQNTGIDCI